MSRERYQVKFAVYLFLRRDNKILLLKRHNTGYMDGRTTKNLKNRKQRDLVLLDKTI